ncbi:hypothetical protein Pla163_37870 [Planctomycetes bacterium Pla163]|uniref:Uncharacterized protein n=1 Tax=Rohdeia mirabilis TaxID=2528008 RepID=A0A518D588_9BACT|nr:hypothetical protein Pla163_37870 [Planctomycetes bacterium Pla163]
MLHSLATLLLAAGATPVATPLAAAPGSIAAAPAALAAAPQDLDALRAVGARALAKALELAEWADAAGYESGRNEMYEVVLSYDPEDKDARKALGFKKKKGEWEQGRRKDPKDEFEPGVPEEFAQLKQAALAELRGEVDAAFEGIAATPQTEARRRAELAKLLPFDPDDAALRTALGQSRHPVHGVWMLDDTLTAIERRAELAETMATLRANLDEPSEDGVDELARDIELDWVTTLRLGQMNITSTFGPEDTRQLIETAQLTRDLFRSIFRRAGSPGYPTVIYALEPSQRNRFFTQHSLTPPDELEYRIQVTSSWLTGRVVISDAAQIVRNDLTAFQTAGYALTEKFGVWTDDGWAQQGLTSYLAHHVCGTRLSFWDIRTKDEYGKEIGGAKSWLDRVPPSTEGWLLLARALVVDEGLTVSQFARALTTPTVKMAWEDVVISHAVAAYLVESRPEALFTLMGQIKGEGSLVRAFEEELGLPLEAFRDRLVQWIEELEVTLPALEEAAAAAAPPAAEAPAEGGETSGDEG